jgi:hypothetical protein
MSTSLQSSEIDHFLTRLQSSGLISIDDLKIACSEFREGNQISLGDIDLFMLCDYLVKSNRLTVWQCVNLLSGRHKGFYLDQYKILNWIAVEENCSVYLAIDLKTNQRVKLRVTPPNIMPRKEGKPHYTIEELNI